MSLDSRVAALDGLLEEAGLDAVLATKDASIAYFTGFWGLQLERFFGVAVKRGGAGALIAPSLDRESVAAAPTGLEQDALRRRRHQRAAGAVRDARRRQADRRRGGPPELRPRARADRGRLRARARDGRWSCSCGRQGRRGGRGRPARLRAHPGRLRRAVGELKLGDTEAEINARVAYMLARRGAKHPEPHILFGEHSADGRRLPGRRELREPATSSSPTSPPSSTATGATSRAARTPARRATGRARRGRSCMRPTSPRSPRRASATRARDVDAAQREIIEAHPDVGACLHGAGHAIGTEVHEPPFLIASSDAPLREGMIFTVEPGIYHSERGGIRLEDDVLVGPDGPVCCPITRWSYASSGDAPLPVGLADELDPHAAGPRVPAGVGVVALDPDLSDAERHVARELVELRREVVARASTPS